MKNFKHSLDPSLDWKRHGILERAFRLILFSLGMQRVIAKFNAYKYAISWLHLNRDTYNVHKVRSLAVKASLLSYTDLFLSFNNRLYIYGDAR
jgi:hypothetical protein